MDIAPTQQSGVKAKKLGAKTAPYFMYLDDSMIDGKMAGKVIGKALRKTENDQQKRLVIAAARELILNSLANKSAAILRKLDLQDAKELFKFHAEFGIEGTQNSTVIIKALSSDGDKALKDSLLSALAPSQKRTILMKLQVADYVENTVDVNKDGFVSISEAEKAKPAANLRLAENALLDACFRSSSTRDVIACLENQAAAAVPILLEDE